MDFKQIEAFISVAKLKSFSKAAHHIFLSQPTISSHISSLEKELNIQLFDRTSKEVNLTPAGESFLEYAINIINTRNNAISHVCSFNKKVCGKLSLIASSTPCNSIVPNLILDFNKKHPEAHFQIKELSSGEVLKKVINFEYELGIIGNKILHDKISTYKLFDDELVIISNHDLNLPNIVDLQTLKKQKFIIRDKTSATRKIISDTLRKYNLNLDALNVVCEVNNLDTLLHFVKTGMGISIVSKKIFKDSYRCCDIRISYLKDITITRGIYLITNSKRTLTPCGRAFLNLCSEKFNFIL